MVRRQAAKGAGGAGCQQAPPRVSRVWAAAPGRAALPTPPDRAPSSSPPPTLPFAPPASPQKVWRYTDPSQQIPDAGVVVEDSGTKT
jgi:hypothetical protein